MLLRAFITMLVVVSSHVAAAAISDKVVCFSSNGFDSYADGTSVIDGECYALVWSPKGSAFAGFNADGTVISSTDRVVLAAPLAHGGKCRDSIFQIPAAEYAELEGGEWAVCLVDTRNAAGVPVGVRDGVPLRVNRWGIVSGGVEIKPAGASALMAAVKPNTGIRRMLATAVGSKAESGTRAENLSAVPATAKRPKITSLTVEDGVVRLTVEDTEPYLTYGVASGATPSALDADDDAGIADGEAGAALEFKADASGGSRFFKVRRAE